MARSPIDLPLPRMQNQARPRVVVPRVRAPIVPQAGKVAPRKPQMMRQYDLIERVKQYNPAADEDLLNRAYVYAMRAHGEQMRDSGDPYFSHPLQVAAILSLALCPGHIEAFSPSRTGPPRFDPPGRMLFRPRPCIVRQGSCGRGDSR